MTPSCFEDDFHIVEHILLRPKDNYYPLFDPASCCEDCSTCIDPYSFRISVIVPNWAPRFADPLRFHHFCQTLRGETPAHIAVRICKYDRNQMYQFELAYYNWLYEQGKEKPDMDAVRDAAIVLINFLKEETADCGDPVTTIIDLPSYIDLQNTV